MQAFRFAVITEECHNTYNFSISFRSSQMYYMFGFLFLVFIILVITCSETTVLLCYFHLCSEVCAFLLKFSRMKFMAPIPRISLIVVVIFHLQDYRWWWRSFLTSGFTAFYLFLYCVHYFFTKLNIEGVTSTLLYFGYTMIMVFLFFLLTGRNFNICVLLSLIHLIQFYILVIFWKFLFSYRNNWFRSMLLVCSKNLQRGEGGLEAQ